MAGQFAAYPDMSNQYKTINLTKQYESGSANPMTSSSWTTPTSKTYPLSPHQPKDLKCHNLSPDTPDWPLTHLWDPTYPLTSTLDSGHSDFPTTPGTLFSYPTDPTCLPTCLPATPEDSIWSGSHMKMCTWCTGPSHRSSDAPEIHHHIMMAIKVHHMSQ